MTSQWNENTANFQNITELPNNLEYSLRIPSESRTEDSNAKIYYYAEGFLPIQDAIARAFIQSKSSGMSPIGKKHSPAQAQIALPEIQMQQYPDTINTSIFEWQGIIAGFCLLLSFTFPVMLAVLYINREKKTHAKEIMIIMGVPSCMHWFGWFMRGLIFVIIEISIIVPMIKVNFALSIKNFD